MAAKLVKNEHTPIIKFTFFPLLQGEICIHGDFAGGMTVFNDEYPNGKVIESLGGYNAAFVTQMNDFISCVVEGKPLQRAHGGSVWEGIKDMFVSTAIYKSVMNKRWENCDLNKITVEN